MAPWDLAIGPDGDLYVAEFTGSRVSKITSNGSVSTYVEIPESFRGHATSIAFSSSGDLYVVINRLEGDGILKIFPNLTVTPFANSFSPYTELSGGLGQLAIGPSGDIFVIGASEIFRITPNGVVTTFASELSLPWDLEFDPSGDIFVFEAGSGKISRITPDGTITVFASGLPNYTFREGGYLAFDVQGNLLLNDRCWCFYRVTPNGTVISLGKLPDLVLGCYDDMIFDSSGNLYVTDGSGSRILKVFPNNTVSVLVDGFMSTGLAVGPSGDIFAIDTASVRGDPSSMDILKVSLNGTSTTFATVSGIASDIDFNATGVLYVAVFDGGKILKIDPNGEVSTFVTGLHNPGRLAFGQSGDLFVLESYNGNVLRITPEGEISTLATGFGDVTTGSLYGSLAADSLGNVFLGSQGENNTIYKIFQNGTVTTFATGIVETGLWNCGDIIISPSGEIFATEAATGKLYRITQDEVTLFATGLTNDAHSITCSSSGELFIGRAGSIVKISEVITPPEIANVQATPIVQEIYDYVNITAFISDNVTVNNVYVNITYPNGTTLGNFSMIGIGLDANRNGTYYYNSTYSVLGIHTYYIWANDTSGNGNKSSEYQFTITVRIATTKVVAPPVNWLFYAGLIVVIILVLVCVGIGISRRKKAQPPEKPAGK